MSDLYLLFFWMAVLGGGIFFCVFTKSKGLKTTYVRDLLHIGTGLWVLGLPFWIGAAIPVAVVCGALVGVLLVPPLSRRFAGLDKFYRSVSDERETWTGIVFFVVSYAIFTSLGLIFRWTLFPAACAMAALSIGDGIGGLLGSSFGEAGYRLPWSKRKTYLGSAAVALGSLVAILIVAGWFNLRMRVPFSPSNLGWFALAMLAACLVEASSPRSSDNLLVPAAVFVALLPTSWWVAA